MVEAWISRGVFLAVLLLQFLLSAAVGLPACSDHAMQGQVDFTGNCSWPSQQPARPGSSLELRGQSAGLFPAVIIANRHAHGGQTVPGKGPKTCSSNKQQCGIAFLRIATPSPLHQLSRMRRIGI